MAATEESLKYPVIRCELVMISGPDVPLDLEKPETNQYILTWNEIYFWSPQLDEPKKIDLLTNKSWETFKQTLKLNKNRKATESDLETIRFFTGHRLISIDELPLEIISEIANRLPDEQTRSKFALTCRLFHNAKSATQSDSLFPKLLTYVLYGEQDKAERILKQYPELLLRRTDFTDPWTKKSFKDTSVFQYALWVKDTRMYNMMLDCLPQNEQGEEIRKSLLEQAKAQTEHFDFTPYIRALQTWVDNFDAWDEPNREANWCGKVGWAQKDLPAHVCQEYCSRDHLFYPIPDFTRKRLTRSLQFYNWVFKTWENWRPWTGLGWEFAFVRGWADGRQWGVSSDMLGGVNQPRLRNVINDLAVMTALSEVRTADIGFLMQRLQRPIYKPDDTLGPASLVIP